MLPDIAESIHVLHVDDDPNLADVASSFLAREFDAITVETATNAGEGLDRLAAGAFDCIVSDFEMPGQNGIEFLQAVRDEHPDLPFILYTGKGSEEIASEAISAGVTDYLQKEAGVSQYAVLANRIVNVVEQYRSKREVLAGRKRLALFFDQSPLGVIEWNEDFEFVRCNETASEILGYAEDELVGASWEQIVPDSHRDEVAAVVSELLEAEGGHHSVNENVTKDGETIVCEWHNRVITDGGSVVTIFSQFQDVTEEHHRRRRQELQRDTLLTLTSDDAVTSGDFETATRRITETAADVLDVSRVNIWLFDDDGGDETLTCVDHYDRASGDHTSGMELVPHEYPAYFDALEDNRAIDAADARADPRTAELTEDYLEVNDIGALLDGTLRAEGDVIGVICHEHVGGTRDWTDDELEFVSDVADVVLRALRNHERRERERELERYEVAVETARDGIAIWDADGVYRLVNDAFVEGVGIPESEIIGKRVGMLADRGIIDESTIDRGAEAALDLVMNEEDQVTFEATIDSPVHGEMIVEVNLALRPPGPDDDWVGGAVATVRPITPRKQRERELRRQNERLDEFTGVISHDLRNPLNVAQGRLALAREDRDDENLRIVANALDRIQAMIDDLLTLAREGKSVSEMEPIDLAETAESCWRNVETTDATLAVETQRSIRADNSRLQQLLENLIRNGVEHGGPEVSISVGECEDGFYVADDGPGIPREDRSQAFESGYSTTESGTGFGLAIVQEIAHAHEWSVRVTDHEGGGARFEITGVEFVDG